MDLRLVAEILDTVAGSDGHHEPEDDEDISKGEVVLLFVALGLLAVSAIVFLLSVTDYTVMEIGEEAWTMAADSCMIFPLLFVAFAVIAQVWVALWVWRKITGLAAKGVEKVANDLKK
jgi:Zn-dependent protease with chaperone function